MKRLFFCLTCLVLCMGLTSCSEDRDLTGYADLTIGTSTYHMPIAEYVFSDGTTSVVGTNVAQTISIDFNGNSVRKYVIGYGDSYETISNSYPFGEGFSKETDLKFVSSVDEREEYVAVCGIMTVSEYGSDSIVATFSGKMLDRSHADALAGGYMKLLFPHWTSVDKVDPEEFDQYCLQPAIRRRGIVKEQCHYIDPEFKTSMPNFWVIDKGCVENELF